MAGGSPSLCGTICCSCNKIIEASKVILVCCVCKKTFHPACKKIFGSSLSLIQKKADSWTCSNDCQKLQKPNLEETINSPGPAEQKSEFGELKVLIKNLHAGQQILTERIDQLTTQNQKILNENIQLKNLLSLSNKTNEKYEKKISYLEGEIDIIKQEKLASNIIVAGLPNLSTDDVTSTIHTIFKTIGAKVTERDVKNITKISTNTVKDNNSSIQENLYLLELNTIKAKQEIIDKKKLNYSKLFTHSIGLNNTNNHQIYIRDHLTSYKLQLYRSAKFVKDKYKFKYLWVKEGRIFLRKEDKSKVYPINTEGSLEELKKKLEYDLSTITTTTSSSTIQNQTSAAENITS